MYHGFTDRETHQGIENHQGKHLFIERFKSHLEYLKKYHRVISLEEWLKGRTGGRKAPDHAAIVTFDDGYESNYKLAFPWLKRAGLPATIFLTTRFVDSKEWLWTDRVEYAVDGGFSLPTQFHDRASRIAYEKKIRGRFKRIPQGFRAGVLERLEERRGRKLAQEPNLPEIYRPLEWAEINEMVQSGLVSIGSHTHTHAILTRCRPQEAEEELLLSKEIIEKKTGRPCRLFCYPNGERGDFNEETKRRLKEAGYLAGLTTVFGANDAESDPLELKRIGAPHRGGRVEFVMNLYGVTQFLSDLKQCLLKFFR